MEIKEATDIKMSKNADYLLRTRYLYKDDNTGMIIRERMTFVDGNAEAKHEIGDKIQFDQSENMNAELSAVGKQVFTDENINGDYYVDYRLAIREKTFKDMCTRVARYVALAELDYTDDISKVRETEKKFYYMLYNRIFFPNSPTLFNAGKGMMHLMDEDYTPLLNKDKLSDGEYEILMRYWKAHPDRADGMLSACFVIPVGDSMEEITDALKETALILKAGGGVGFNFSNLRPKGAPVKGTAGFSSGPISFMKLFNETGAVVEQGGRRRAALMGSLDVTHPDVEKFIECKKDNDGNSVLNYFNVSVNIDDHEAFMEAHRNDEDILLNHKDTIVKVNARKLLRQIAENAWKTGDPGLQFTGKHNKYYSLSNVEPAYATNPCGEQFLAPYLSCNLLSINLLAMFRKYDINKENIMHKKKEINDVVSCAVRFLDNVIDMNRYPLKKNEEAAKQKRPVGLGVMGLADTMYTNEIRYDSDDGYGFTAMIMSIIAYLSYQSSSELGKERGTFPLHDQSRFVDPNYGVPFSKANDELCGRFASEVYTLNDNIDQDFPEFYKTMRHSQCNTVAPTGSISNLADVSSGIEPNFSLAYSRYITNRDGSREKLNYINPVVYEMLDELPPDPEDEDIKRLLHGKASVFVTSHDIDPLWHLKIQQAAQSYVDVSISKTINMPESATVEEIEDIYLRAIGSNLKGITVYRDGSLQHQVLTKDEKKHKVFFNKRGKLLEQKRPESMPAISRKFTTEKGTTFVNVTFDPNGYPFDIFISDNKEKSEVMGRLISMLLRIGADIEKILETLRKVKYGDYSHKIADEIEKAINDYGTDLSAEDNVLEENATWDSRGFYVTDEGDTICPECGSKNTIEMQEGCMICKSCMTSKCS